MTKSKASAAHAVAKPQVPIMVTGWTQDPVFLGEKYYHPVNKTLSEFYIKLLDHSKFSKEGVGFDKPFESFECIEMLGKRFEFESIHVFLHYCYGEGRISEEELCAHLLTEMPDASIHEPKEEYSEAV